MAYDNDSNQHVIKTSSQWNERAMEYWVVPRGCLCIELTPKGKTKIKVGEGNKFYHQLPYIGDIGDLSEYYTKTEIDTIVENLNKMAIASTDVYDTRNDLPKTGNKLGDVRFVKNPNSSSTDPLEYLWNGKKWIYLGGNLLDIDLSEYVKRNEIFPRVEALEEKAHTHSNKDILDKITAPYTVADKTKLDSLENYDDTDVKNDISELQETAHTHDNKDILDLITYQFTIEDKNKLDSLEDYNDRITDLEEVAHSHDNKDILDDITAAYTVEEKEKLSSLENYDVFSGADMYAPGSVGLVPQPFTSDVGKFLSSDGTWKTVPSSADVSDYTGATEDADGIHGLVPAALAGQQTYFLRGDGTWNSIAEYEAGTGISFNDSDDLYKIVEYLEYTGGHQLNTGLTVTRNTLRIQIKWRQNTLGATNTLVLEGNYLGWMWFGVHNTSKIWYGWTALYESMTTGTIYEDEMEVINGVSMRLNDQIFANSNISRKINPILLYSDSSGAANVDIFYIRIYDDNELLSELIPTVQSATNTPGYYDTVRKIFLAFPYATVGKETGKVIGNSTIAITNNGVLDVTQDPDELNKLTFSYAEKEKVITIPTTALPKATDTTLGGVVVGDGLVVDSDGVISVDTSVYPPPLGYLQSDGINIFSAQTESDEKTSIPYVDGNDYTSNGIRFITDTLNGSITVSGTSTGRAVYGIYPWWEDVSYDRLFIPEGTVVSIKCDDLPDDWMYNVKLMVHNDIDSSISGEVIHNKYINGDNEYVFVANQDCYLAYGIMMQSDESDVTVDFTCVPSVKFLTNANKFYIQNTGVLSVTQDPDDMNTITVTTKDGSTDITIPTTASDYVAGDGIYFIEDPISESGWTSDAMYTFTDTVSCGILGRTYTRVNAGKAVVAIAKAHTSDGTKGITYPLAVSDNPDYILWRNSYDNKTYPTNPEAHTFEYMRITWYYSVGDMGWNFDTSGASTAGDQLGNLSKLNGDTVYETYEDAAIALLETANVSIPHVTSINVSPATADTIGGVIIGDGIDVNEDGVISIDASLVAGVSDVTIDPDKPGILTIVKNDGETDLDLITNLGKLTIMCNNDPD